MFLEVQSGNVSATKVAEIKYTEYAYNLTNLMKSVVMSLLYQHAYRAYTDLKSSRKVSC